MCCPVSSIVREHTLYNMTLNPHRDPITSPMSNAAEATFRSWTLLSSRFCRSAESPAGSEDTTPVDTADGTDETIEVVTTVPAEIAGRVDVPVPVALPAGMNVIGNVWIVAIFEPKCGVCSEGERSLEGRSSVSLEDEELNALRRTRVSTLYRHRRADVGLELRSGNAGVVAKAWIIWDNLWS